MEHSWHTDTLYTDDAITIFYLLWLYLSGYRR